MSPLYLVGLCVKSKCSLHFFFFLCNQLPISIVNFILWMRKPRLMEATTLSIWARVISQGGDMISQHIQISELDVSSTRLYTMWSDYYITIFSPLIDLLLRDNLFFLTVYNLIIMFMYISIKFFVYRCISTCFYWYK